MKLSTTIRHFLACFVCMAMVFASLAPALTHASAGAKWAELCTMDGVKLVKVSDADSAPGQPADMGQHCAHCLIQADLSAPVTFAVELVHPLEIEEDYPDRHVEAPQLQTTWSSPQSRAPPSSS